MTLTTSHKRGFPTRTVARPVANLGNTCYMNAVVQALAACPELCMALDCRPHRPCCPVYAENLEKSRASSPFSNDTASATSQHSWDELPLRKTATRKSLRASGRRTPSSDDGKKADWTFCTLCELEDHLHKVHVHPNDDNQESASASSGGPMSSSSHHHHGRPVAPTAFVNGFMEHVAPWFELGQQEDSHEFLRLLIDAMQKSCEKARPRQVLMPPDHADDSPTATRTRAARQKNSSMANKDTEYPFSLFRGRVESTVTCEYCKATSSTLDPIEDIGLEVVAQPAGQSSSSGTASNNNNITTTTGGSTRATSGSRNASPTPAPLADLTASFQRFTRPEALDAGYKCEKCGNVGRATKQSRLAEVPPILTLHLKRFRYGESVAPALTRRSGREVGQLLTNTSGSGTGNVDSLYGGGSGSAKIEGHIKFEFVMDLKKYLTPELQEQQSSMICRLFAVIVHAGKNSHSGHYIAYVRNQNKDEWWKMDDGRVTHATRNQVLAADAYMLFYRVVQHPVTVNLEKEYNSRLEEVRSLEMTTAQEKTPSVDVTPVFDPIKDTTSTKNRKRTRPAFASGEEWVNSRSKRPPPHLIEIVHRAEQHISEEVIVKKDVIQNAVSKRNGGTRKDLSDHEKIEHVITGKSGVPLQVLQVDVGLHRLISR
jgi:ubiquitin C-terminal hydrolase